MSLETIIALCCLIAFAGSIASAVRAKGHADRLWGGFAAIAALIAGLLSLQMGHRQGDTITAQGQKIAAQQQHIASLDQENLVQVHLLTVLAQALSTQERQITQTRTAVGSTQGGLVLFAKAMQPRDINGQISSEITSFAAHHKSIKFTVSGKKNDEGAEYLANAIRYALHSGGANTMPGYELSISPPPSRILLMTSIKDKFSAAQLYRALQQIDSLATWQKSGLVPQGEVFIAVGGLLQE